MLNRLPRLVMPLSMILGDIGDPSPRELARALGVSERTVFRWIKADEAPKAVMLALFWLTRWGHSQVNAEAHNDAVMHASVARALGREVGDLTAKLARLGRIADFGSANDPAPGVARPAPLLPPAQPADTDQPASHPGEIGPVELGKPGKPGRLTGERAK